MSSGEEFDVLVIGGGATGCGVALDSVSRGNSLTISLDNQPNANLEQNHDSKEFLLRK